MSSELMCKCGGDAAWVAPSDQLLSEVSVIGGSRGGDPLLAGSFGSREGRAEERPGETLNLREAYHIVERLVKRLGSRGCHRITEELT